MTLALRCKLSVSFLFAQFRISAGLASHFHNGPADALLGLRQRPQDSNIAFIMPKPSSYLGYRESGGMECGLNHSKDLYRPIPTVLAEHPGVDGFCYFEFHAPWLAYTEHQNLDYRVEGMQQVKHMRAQPTMCPMDPGMDKGPLVDISYLGDSDMVTLHSHLDCMHMGGDDVYCHAMGWLKNQRFDDSLMSNRTAWEELAKQECNRFQQKYRFTEDEITIGKHVDDQNWIWKGPARNLVLHAYHKCLLGHGVDEMTYCQSLSCLLPGNVVGHGGWCK